MIPERLLKIIYYFPVFLSALGEDVLELLWKLFSLTARILTTPVKALWRLMKKAGRLIAERIGQSFREQVGDERYFTGRLYRALKTLGHALLKAPATVPAVIRYYIRRGLIQYKSLIRYALLILLPVVCFLGMLGVIDYYADASLALRIDADGVTLGYVAEESDFLEARNLARTRLGLEDDGARADELLPEVTYTLALISINRYTGTEKLCDNIIENSKVKIINACGVYIDGAFLCAVKNEADAKRVFDSLLASYDYDGEGTLYFKQEIDYVEGLYPDNENVIWDSKRLSENIRLKTVTDSTAAAQDGVLTVKVVKTEVYTEEVPYESIEVPSDALFSGTKRTVVTGVNGLAQVTALVTYVNGEKTFTEEISRLTVEEPVNERIQVGTKSLEGTYSVSSFGGVLVWPAVNAYNINSPYGYRWGKLHSAIDIGSATGTSQGKLVLAAAEGTVVIAGVHSSYGYYIKIDHGGGMQTLYAHCMANSLMVSVGDHVSAGQAIARIGQTGYATGPHLHFEVIINGDKVDPAPYLGIK